MSKIDLTKMVEDLVDVADTWGDGRYIYNLFPLLRSMAAEIKANTEKIKKLKHKAKYMR